MEKTIRRYSAYFPRWCQAFGDHQPDAGGEGRAVEWLIGGDSVGVIVLPEVRYLLLHALLGVRQPLLELWPRYLRLNGRDYAEPSVIGHAGYVALLELLREVPEAYMFLTYHLIYPPGTRIITVSSKPPLPLLYKEMAPLPVIVYN